MSLDIEKLYNEQKDFFNSGRTKNCSFRAAALKKLRDSILRCQPEIEQALFADLGKAPFEGYIAEIGIVLEEISDHIMNLKEWSKPQRVSSPITVMPAKSYVYPEPFGCTLIMAPWNYPFQLLMAPLVGAVSAGCCAIVKPSNMSVHTEKIIAKIVSESFDSAHVASVCGGRGVIQDLLTRSYDYIFFTGGIDLGKIVAESAAKHLTPVTLELGGKSPCIVTGSAHLQTAARRFAWGKFLNAGQTCIAPDYVMVHKSVKEKFLALVEKNIKSFFGAEVSASPDFGRIINDHHFQRITSYFADGKIYTGGTADPASRYISPTVLVDVRPDSPVMTDEIFGPVAPVLEYESLDEVVAFVRGRPRPLALYLFSGKRKEQKKIFSELSFGGGCVNDVIMHVANPNLPFGGVGMSGMGSYHGKKSFDTFTHYKGMLKNWNWPDMPVRYAPYSRWKKRLIQMILG